MTYLLIVGDGLADYPLEELGGKTPLAAAHTPAMDALARRGVSGLLEPIPRGYPATSDVALLSLLGYDLRASSVGPAAWRAPFAGHRLRDGEMAFLCDVVTLGRDHLVDATAGGLTEAELTELVRALNETLGTEDLRFERGVGASNLLIVRGATASILSACPLHCVCPADIQGSEYRPFRPSGEHAEMLVELMDGAEILLRDHPVNTARRNGGAPLANGIWLWGPSRRAFLEPFSTLHGCTGALISHVPAVQSAGAYLGLEIVDPGPGGDRLGFNYEGRVEAALRALARSEFVVLYVEAPEAAAGEDAIEHKIRMIEAVDQRVVAPIVAQGLGRRGVRLGLASDRIVSVLTGAQASGPVPFALCGPGVPAMARGGFCEAEAAFGGVRYSEGFALTRHLLNPDPMGFTTDR